MALVCDGLGGMSQGREAAILAASAFTSKLFCTPTFGPRERLHRAVAYANNEVYRALRGDGGTTLSAVVCSPHYGTMLCHVGDSRIYGVSPDRALEQLSRDDTINAFLKKRGGEAEAPKDSRLLQFVGMGDEMEAQISSIPGYYRSLLLTSDGAHDVPSSILQRVVSAAAGGSDLIRKLLALSEMLGGRDNASAILCPITSEPEIYDETDENELLAILPHDTVAIYVADLETSDLQERHRNHPSENPRQESRSEGPPTKDAGPSSGPAPKTKPKPKGRTTKSRSTKRRSARSAAEESARLPLEQPGNEVDVKFSSPSTQTEEDKQ